MSRHVSVPSVTIGTHRLWISLWTRLGQDEDNIREPGGNRKASGGERAAVHSPSPAGHWPRTGPVTGKRHPGLRGKHLSPGSTDPTTTTNFFFTTKPNASRWVARARSRGWAAGAQPRRAASARSCCAPLGGTRSRLEACACHGPRARQRYARGPRPLTLPGQHGTGRAAHQHLTGGSFR